MANPFDRFDAPTAAAAPRSAPPPASNPFDQFDAPAGGSGGNPGALSIRVRAGGPVAPSATPPISRDAFEDRFQSDLSAPYRTTKDTTADDPAYAGLYDPLRTKADERLIGPPSARNTALAALYEAGSEASLNLAGNLAALTAGGLGALGVEGFERNTLAQNRQLFDDQRAAFARQSPKAATAGTVAGIGAGALALPGLAGAPAATLARRAGQAAITGGVYGGVAEGLDSFDPLRSAGAAGLGALLGGTGSAAIEKAAPHVISAANRAWPAISQALGRGVPVVTDRGRFTQEAEGALREIGLDPAQLPDELAGLFTDAFRAKGVSPAIAREAAASEFGIPLTRGQATQDPAVLGRERAAISGLRGGKAQEIGQGFAARQSEAVSAARGQLQAMAARGAPLIESPAVAAEAVSDSARRAAGAFNADVLAAQQAEEAARRLARGGDGDALDAASTVATGVRGAAERSREGYRGAYGEAAQVEGEFRPDAFDRLGERVRTSLSGDMPVDPVVTPAASRALADLDNLPALLAKPDGSGATPADVETIRRRLLAYRRTTGANAQDRATIDAIMRRFDDHIEGAEGAGLFGPRAAPVPGAPAAAVDDFPGAASLPELIPAPPVREGEPESLIRFLARTGGIPLDDEARAADLNRLYVPGAGTLARRNSSTWDQIRVRLAEQGFLPGDEMAGASPRDVADRVFEQIRAERQGRPAVRMADEGAVGARRGAERVADENANFAVQVDREARRIAIDLEGYGLTGSNLDQAALREAAEAVRLGRTDDGVAAYDAAVARRAGEASPTDATLPDVPFPELGEGVQVASPNALPGGSDALTTAMRNARGLFRQHQQNFKPRGRGDDAGRLMAKIIEQDATPAEIATALFGSISRPGEAGLSIRFAGRLREVLGAGSPELAALQQGLMSRAIDGNGTGDAARRVDSLLRGSGREAANTILTEDQRRALGAWRGALAQLEQRRQALPGWISDLAKKDFDPNAVASGLFGSGVPGERIGSANFAKGLKGFLGETSPEWSSLRQAALMNLTSPGSRTLSPSQEADRVAEFVRGKGAGLAEHLFTSGERAQLMRYASAVRATALPSGIAAPDAGGKRAAAAHILNGVLGAIAAKVATPFAASAPFTAQVGQRLIVRGPAAYTASQSFQSGAPRARPVGPVLDLQRVGTGAGLSAQYGMPSY